MKTTMAQSPKKNPGQKPHPAYAAAFVQLDSALSKARTPSDLTEEEKTELWVQKLWGKRTEAARP